MPAHVGIYGNEKADRLAKSAMKRAHRNRITTPAQRQDRMLDDMAEDIVELCYLCRFNFYYVDTLDIVYILNICK